MPSQAHPHCLSPAPIVPVPSISSSERMRMRQAVAGVATHAYSVEQERTLTRTRYGRCPAAGHTAHGNYMHGSTGGGRHHPAWPWPRRGPAMTREHAQPSTHAHTHPLEPRRARGPQRHGAAGTSSCPCLVAHLASARAQVGVVVGAAGTYPEALRAKQLPAAREGESRENWVSRGLALAGRIVGVGVGVPTLSCEHSWAHLRPCGLVCGALQVHPIATTLRTHAFTFPCRRFP